MHTNNGHQTAGAQTTAIAVRDQHQEQQLERTAFEPNSVDQALQLLGQIQPTGLLPKHIKNPQSGLLCLILGREHGLTMMQSLMHLFVVPGGFPQMSVELLVAKVRASGVCAAFSAKEFTDEKVTVYGKRKDTGEEMSSTWTIATATKAGLMGKDNWRHYPRRMLFARAAGDVIKALFQDVTIGLVSREEMMDDPNVIDVTPGTPAIDVSPAATASSPVEALKALAKAGAAMPAPAVDPGPAFQKLDEETKPAATAAPISTATPEQKPPEPAAIPSGENKADASASPAEMTQDQFDANKARLAGMQKEFVETVGDKNRAKDLWTGSVAGVAGVQSLRGCTTHAAWEKRFAQANALLDRARRNIELAEARRSIITALGEDAGTKRIRALGKDYSENAFTLTAEGSRVVLDALLGVLAEVKPAAESIVVPEADEFFEDDSDPEPGSNG